MDTFMDSFSLTLDQLIKLHSLKTGALIRAACEMGCILAGADENKLSAAKAYAEKIGLAFQITDDILDVTSSTEELGKPVGSDMEQQKTTYVSVYGIEGARARSAQLLNEAKEELKTAGFGGDFLSDLADYILERKN